MAGVSTDKSNGKVQVFDSEEELAVSLAKYVSYLSEKVCQQRTSFTVVVSGGSLIKSLRLYTISYLPFYHFNRLVDVALGIYFLFV